jgi:hypothetical protein
MILSELAFGQSEQNEFITHFDTLKPLYNRGMHLEPGVRGCAGYLGHLFRKIGDGHQKNREGATLCSVHMQVDI